MQFDIGRFNTKSVRNIAITLGIIWVGLMLYNGLTQISGVLTIRNYQTNFFRGLVFLTLLVWLPWVLMSPILVALAQWFPVRPQRWLWPIVVHALALLILSLGMGLVLGVLYHHSGSITGDMQTYEPWQHAGHYLFGDRIFLFNAIIYTIVIATFNIQNFYALALQRERDSATLQSQLKDAQLRALKMQINPHFLFNTLNSIDVLVLKKDTDKAQAMIQQLGKFFRANIEESNDLLIPLSKELDTLSQYLAIEQIRFADRLVVVNHYDAEAMELLVPPFILQPLVENAVRHGVGNCDHHCEIIITTKLGESGLSILIEDNGAGCNFDAPDCTEGIGIRNVRDRLQQCYGTHCSLNLSGKIGQGVKVELHLPADKMRNALTLVEQHVKNTHC